MREQIPDSVLMYACIFTYEKQSVRTQILNYQPNTSVIENLETSNQLPPNSANTVRSFIQMGHDQQREFLDSRAEAENVMHLMRTLLQIVSKISSEPELVRWALALINGIIEDRRDRIKFMAQLQKSSNPNKKLDCIRILNSYLNQQMEADQKHERDMAAHTLAQLISNTGLGNKGIFKEEASNFLNYLLQAKDNPA